MARLRRTLVAAALAGALVAAEVALVWAFFALVWPRLPPWAAMIGFIALAVFAIGSPLVWLARAGGPVKSIRRGGLPLTGIDDSSSDRRKHPPEGNEDH